MLATGAVDIVKFLAVKKLYINFSSVLYCSCAPPLNEGSLSCFVSLKPVHGHVEVLVFSNCQ